MTQEQKQLLLQDLCARLPYGVKVKLQMYDGTSMVADLTAIEKDGLIGLDIPADVAWNLEDIKPYLRSMSSMTEEEEKEFNDQMYKAKQNSDDKSYNVYEVTSLNIDWLDAHHFDYRGLIPMGLALSAPEGMYK